MNDDLDSYREDGTFVLTYPCFVIKNKSGTGGIVFDIEDGNIALLVLTDEDAADRFCRKHGYTGHGRVQFNGAVDLLEYLDILPDAITQVAFDTVNNRQLIERLRHNLMERMLGMR